MRDLALKLAVLTLPLSLGGCVKTVASVVKAPFQAAGQVVDWTTTSQSEADRNYGRKMRKQEAKEGRERREYEKQCRKHPEQCQQQGQQGQQGYDGYRAGY
ncbi:hypothetical protein [uncultured Sphingomonas sp.]|uniref:hypothetical protein n=1 Tax=uncultured Sphingomonas sp. TaxID=158754 RepID=UPI0025ECA95E|nr:hypothetical protein [uncultured Sphingomonas sp.]